MTLKSDFMCYYFLQQRCGLCTFPEMLFIAEDIFFFFSFHNNVLFFHFGWESLTYINNKNSEFEFLELFTPMAEIPWMQLSWMRIFMSLIRSLPNTMCFALSWLRGPEFQRIGLQHFLKVWQLQSMSNETPEPLVILEKCCCCFSDPLSFSEWHNCVCCAQFPTNWLMWKASQENLCSTPFCVSTVQNVQ